MWMILSNGKANTVESCSWIQFRKWKRKKRGILITATQGNNSDRATTIRIRFNFDACSCLNDLSKTILANKPRQMDSSLWHWPRSYIIIQVRWISIWYSHPTQWPFPPSTPTRIRQVRTAPHHSSLDSGSTTATDSSLYHSARRRHGTLIRYDSRKWRSFELDRCHAITVNARTFENKEYFCTPHFCKCTDSQSTIMTFLLQARNNSKIFVCYWVTTVV